MSNRPDMDLTPEARRVFDQYLQTISFRSEVYYRGQICEDWYLDTSGTGHINVHVVCHGDCWFRLPGLSEPVHLNAGDVVVQTKTGPSGPVSILLTTRLYAALIPSLLRQPG